MSSFQKLIKRNLNPDIASQTYPGVRRDSLRHDGKVFTGLLKMILAIIKCYDDDRNYLSYKGCWYVDCHLSVPVLILNHDGVVVCGVVHHVGQVLLRRTAAAKAPGVLLPQLHRVGHIISVTPLVMELVLCMSRSWTAFSQLHCGWLKKKISSTTFTLL